MAPTDKPPATATPGATKLFWWPCPNCRLWHQTRLALELLDEDSVEVRCPVNGRAFERPVTHLRSHVAAAGSHRPGLLRRIFRRLRGAAP